MENKGEIKMDIRNATVKVYAPDPFTKKWTLLFRTHSLMSDARIFERVLDLTGQTEYKIERE
jgi:hypothetical protein